MTPAPVATAYLHRSADELSPDRGDSSASATTRSATASSPTNVRDAWRREFIVGDGAVRPTTQANLSGRWRSGSCPKTSASEAASDLVALIRSAGTHLGTGFLATPFLLPVLADHGHLDVAYELLFQDTEPSWLLMLDRGATTIWEEWGGIARRRHPVGLAQPLQQGRGHLVPAPLRRGCADRRTGLPALPCRTTARRWHHRARSTHHDSPHGRIEVSWSLTADGGELAVTVPPGTTAELVLPDGSAETLPPGDHNRRWADSDVTS